MVKPLGGMLLSYKNESRYIFNENYLILYSSQIIIVASGFPIPTGENIEILDLIDPNFKCIFKDERAKRDGEAIGGMLKN